MAKKGLPHKLTKDISEQVCNYVRLGAPFYVAAQAAGITQQTITNWMKEGQAAITLRDEANQELTKVQENCAKFVEEIDQAVAQAHLFNLDRIDKAAEQVWQAAAWWLERKYPELYALRRQEKDKEDSHPTTNVNVTPQEGHSTIDLADMPQALREQIFDYLKSKKAKQPS